MESVSAMEVKFLWGNYFFDHIISEASGNSGGILCAWDTNFFKKDHHTISDNFIALYGTWIPNNQKLLIISVYAPQSVSSKRMLWSYLESLITSWNGESLIMGDFNEVRCIEERWGSVFNSHGANAFNSFISNSGLNDIQLEGFSFTWGLILRLPKMSKLDMFHYESNASWIDDWTQNLGILLHCMIPSAEIKRSHRLHSLSSFGSLETIHEFNLSNNRDNMQKAKILQGNRWGRELQIHFMLSINKKRANLQYKDLRIGISDPNEENRHSRGGVVELINPPGDGYVNKYSKESIFLCGYPDNCVAEAAKVLLEGDIKIAWVKWSKVHASKKFELEVLFLALNRASSFPIVVNSLKVKGVDSHSHCNDTFGKKVRASNIGQLVKIFGIVTRYSDVKPLMKVAVYTCEECGFEIYQIHIGMHSIVNKPMVVGGEIRARPMMYVALTYDRRLIDGREVVFFARRIKDVVEDPRRLLLDI
ncbi:RNA-directed DNA polymerase, eukaryota [Tanacetum coccineum]